jgi:Uma2 family endonuclease
MTEADYEAAASAYCQRLPLEHFMESIGQSTQRKITLESLDLVHARRPDVQIFSELLIQYPRGPRRKLGQVCPDNMVVISNQPVRARGSFNYPFESARPFWLLEYVSESNKRKDYEDNRRLYERELKVPYYLIFDPDEQDLILFRHTGRRYQRVKPDERGRVAIPELNLEMTLLDGWLRFWYAGELLPLPADLQQSLDEARRQLAAATQRAEREEHRAEQEKQRAEQEKQRAEQEQRRADALQAMLDEERAARRAAERELQRSRTNRPSKNS